MKYILLVCCWFLLGCTADTSFNSTLAKPQTDLKVDTGPLIYPDKTSNFGNIYDVFQTRNDPIYIHSNIDTFFPKMRFNDIQKLREFGTVFLEEQEFSGDEVPFVCYNTENVKSFYLGGKRIRFTPNKEFFFRKHINLFLGYNRIPIKIVNSKGHLFNSYLEISMHRVN